MRARYLRPLSGTTQGAMLAQALGPRIIKSIQRGTITFLSSALTGAATITAVNLANAVVSFNGFSITGSAVAFNGGNGPNIWALDLVLTNATTVTGTVGAQEGTGTWSIPYEVIEFYPGAVRSVQRGSITVAVGSATGTASINAVNTATSFMLAGGWLSANAAGAATLSQGMPMVQLVNSTTVTVTRGATGGGTYTLVMPYAVVEF